MPTDEICELTSKILDYVWSVKYGSFPPAHSFKHENGDEYYTDEAQDIYIKIFDTIDNYINEE